MQEKSTSKMTKEEILAKWSERFKNIPKNQVRSYAIEWFDEFYEDTKPFFDEAIHEYNQYILESLVDIKDLNIGDKKRY